MHHSWFETDLWFETALLPDGWAERVRLSIEAGRIVAVETGVDPAEADERNAIGVPGLANVHSHGFQRGMAGLTEYRGPTSDNFWTWRELMYRFLDRLDPDDVQAITAQAYVEMLETGFTRVGEFHYLHHDIDGHPYADRAEMATRVAAAAAETDIGLTLLPVFYAHGNFGGTPPNPGQRRFLCDPMAFARLLDNSRRAIQDLRDAHIGVAPHSLRAATPDELREVCALIPDGPIHIHAAEQVREVEDCIAWSGQRPVEWLLDHMDLDQRWCLIHATHLTDAEIDRLAASGAVAGLCPITEASLGDGVFPAARYLAAGGAFGVGSDSNILIDPARELQGLEYAQRLTRRARNVLASSEQPSTGAALFMRALAGGAQALAQPTFGLRTGASADVVSLNPLHPSLVGRSGDQLLDGWIFASRSGAVDMVWRHGERIVEHGRHRRAGSIAERYARVIRKLLAG